MDKRAVAIIVIVLAILLCACPGLFSLFMGGLFALISFIPGADIDIFGSTDPQSALNFGLGGLGTGFVLVLVAAVVIFIAWRHKGDTVSQ
jgi:uncharacterized membrane protein